MTPDELLEWFDVTFGTGKDDDIGLFALATVVGAHPDRRYWFVDDGFGQIHCHAGNCWRPAGGKLVRQSVIDLEVGDKVIVLPIEGKQGTKGYKWVMLGDVARTYEEEVVS